MFDRSLPHDRRQALFGGKNSVRVWSLVGGELLAPFTALLACELEPGGSVGRHVQEHFPELLLFVEGEGSILVDSEPVQVAPGSVVQLPLGKTLAIENGSDAEPLRYLIIKARTA